MASIDIKTGALSLVGSEVCRQVISFNVMIMLILSVLFYMLYKIKIRPNVKRIQHFVNRPSLQGYESRIICNGIDAPKNICLVKEKKRKR